MDKEKLKGYLDKAKTALGKISKKIWIIIAIAVAVLVIAIVIFLKTRPYATLIAGATDEETATVLSWLQENGFTDYKMEGSGTILVPAGQAPSLKARLLQEQYSKSDSSYSAYFEQVGALSTQEDRRVAQLATLTDNYRKTILQFPGVRDVDVSINPGENRGYVLDSNNMVEASAGVFLFMQNGKTLTDGQANAIRNYIAAGVPGLKVQNVTIEDSNGTDYSGVSSGNAAAAASSALKLQMEKQWRTRIEEQIYNWLAGTFGPDNVKVSVNVTVELGEKTINDYKVTLPEFAEDGSTGGRGVVNKEFYIYQFTTPDEGAVGGVVGTTTNADLPTYVEQGNAEAELQRILEEQVEKDYDNSKTQTQMVITAATLKDVSVTVTIDSENYGPVNVDDVRAGVATSSGILAPLELPDGMTANDYLARYITVVNIPFWREPAPTPTPSFFERLGIPEWVVYAAIGGLVLFVIILVAIILLVRGHKKKKQAAEQRAVEELMATAMPGQVMVEVGPDGQTVVQPVLDENGNPVSGADVMDMHTERSMELRQNIRDYVDENMEVAALLLKSWLKEDADNG
ncbi:MAG: hypothetical protein K2O11_05250 [Oscillospiraceae bacterium]|nr:hypothetical protein [Oscillospiraceae bacterium]